MLGIVGLALAGAATVYFVAKVIASPVGPEATPPLKEATESALGQTRISDLLFFAFAGLTVFSAAGVAFSRNIIYSAFSLLGTLLGIGALFVYLSADFLAVTQLLIYVGGVLVLVLFAVMLTSHIKDIRISNTSIGLAGGVGAFVTTAVLLAVVAVKTPWKVADVLPAAVPTAAPLGNLFLNEYVLPFEVSSVVLLAALVGAVVTARKDLK
jgi:NAD(P)H-quinone oxidoreductase subunit 6